MGDLTISLSEINIIFFEIPRLITLMPSFFKIDGILLF